jgi:hypothetical protein
MAWTFFHEARRQRDDLFQFLSLTPALYIPFSSFLRFHFNLKDIDHIHIRTTEYGRAIWLAGNFSAIPQNIDIRKSDMHSHWAKLASLGIEIKGVTNTMTAMASHMAFLTDQADFDFRFFHRLFLLSDEESVLPFRHRYEKIHFNHTMQGAESV